MADKQRVRRVGEMLQREIAGLLQREIRDPRVKLVTISAVKVNRDLSVARVYYTLLNQFVSEDASSEVSANDPALMTQEMLKAQEGLENINGYLRRLIGKQLLLRMVPRLDFVYDKSIEHGAYMSNFIDDIIAHDKKHTHNSEE